MTEERKLVTVLFADIVGSTELGLDHDPEVVRASLGRAFEAASGILSAHGGTVEKFIGDAVMAVFGVPTAHDDDADRAVRAAFAIRESMADTATGPALRVRIGVNTGEAVAGSAASAQFLVTGPAVNAAARLQQAAAPGEILVGDLTRRLTAGGVDYGTARDVEAKGIGKLAGWTAERVTTEVPEQHRGLPGLRAPLIGRDHELRTLIQVQEGLRKSGQPQLVTVYGPAGSGKSRLTAEFLATVPQDRVRVGRCLPYGEGITYYAIQLMLRADAGIGIADPRDAAIGKLRATTVGAFGGEIAEAEAIVHRVSVLAGLERADDVLPEVQPAQLREELTFGLRRYLERRAGGSPLVLVFEDVHWAEPGLLDLIEHLAEWSRAPLLLLCLARPDFRELRSGWGGTAANATSLTLQPLTSEDTRRLIAELLAIDDLPEKVRSEVITRAEGNPLYVEEFLRMLMETGRVMKRAGRWTATESLSAVEIPPTLQGLITARLDRVEPEVKALLQRASLAGRLFSTDALAALADGAVPDATLLRDAVRRDLIVEADESALGSGRVFRFKHVLIRDVAYSTVPKSERSRLHDRYGRWLEISLGDRRHEIADIIAFHAEQAHLFAHELGAPGSAELGRRALDLLLDAARSAYERADPYAALNVYTRAGAIADPAGATAAERAEIAGFTLLARDETTTARPEMAELDRAIEVARTAAPNAVLPELLALRVAKQRVIGEGPGNTEELLEEAVRAANDTGDADLIARIMFARAFDRYWMNDIDGMYQRLLEAHEHVKRTGSKRGSPILFWLGRAATHRGDYTTARVFVEEAIAARPYQTKWFRGIGLQARADEALGRGDLDAAIDGARQARELMREVGQPGWVANCGWTLGEALLARGDAAAARDALAEASEIFERRGQKGQVPETRARLARALLLLGDRAGALASAEIARATALETDVESRYISAVALGEVREAEGDAAAAEELFREAVALLEPSGLRDVLAEAREHHARFLLRQGRYAESRAELEKVLAFYADPLAELHRQRIETLLKDAAAIRA